MTKETKTVSVTFGRLSPRRDPPPPDVEPAPARDYSALSTRVLEKHVMSLALAERDVRAAWAMCDMLLERPAANALLDTERGAFADAIVAAYSRPFMKGEAKLPPEWPGYTREAWSKRHAAMVEERIYAVGHSDPTIRRLTLEAGEHGMSARLTLPWTMALPGELEKTHAMSADLCNRLLFDLMHAGEILLERLGVTSLELPRP